MTAGNAAAFGLARWSSSGLDQKAQEAAFPGRNCAKKRLFLRRNARPSLPKTQCFRGSGGFVSKKKFLHEAVASPSGVAGKPGFLIISELVQEAKQTEMPAIDYSAAGKWAQHVRALAVVESNEDEVLRGDNGKAFGLLQCHPPFIAQYYRPPHGSDDTWTQAQIRAVAAYFADRCGLHGWPEEDAVQAYNAGVGAFEQGTRAPRYLTKWKAAMKGIGAKT